MSGWPCKLSIRLLLQVLFASEAWGTLEAQSPRIALVMKRALMIPLGMGNLTYSALQDLFPGADLFSTHGGLGVSANLLWASGIV